mgnify:CR=1 FL=1
MDIARVSLNCRAGTVRSKSHQESKNSLVNKHWSLSTKWMRRFSLKMVSLVSPFIWIIAQAVKDSTKICKNWGNESNCGQQPVPTTLVSSAFYSLYSLDLTSISSFIKSNLTINKSKKPFWPKSPKISRSPDRMSKPRKSPIAPSIIERSAPESIKAL